MLSPVERDSLQYLPVPLLRLALMVPIVALGLTLGACGGSGGGSGDDGPDPDTTNGSIEVGSLWPQADSVPPGAFGTTLPTAVESVRYVFRASSGYRCCSVVNPDDLTGNRAITLQSIPAGSGTLQVSGHPTSFADAPGGVTDTCEIDPDIGRPCVQNEPSSPSFDTGARPINVVGGRTTDAGDVQVRAVPFVLLASLVPAPNVPVNSPITIGFTIVDAIYGVDPDSVASALIPLGGNRRNLTVVLRACTDGTATPCTANSRLSVRGFIAEVDAQAIPSRATRIEISAGNLAPVPSSMVFEYGFIVADPQPTPTPSTIATPTVGTPSVQTSTPVIRTATPTASGTPRATVTPSTTPKNVSLAFARAPSFRVSQNPSYLAVEDFNRDGRDDVAVASPQSDAVHILLANADGSFTLGSVVHFGTFPGWIAAGNLNGDAFVDLAVADQRDGGIYVMLGNSNAGFSTPSLRPVGQQPYGVVIDNFDGQPGNDLVVSDSGANEVRVVLGNGQPDPAFRGGGSAAVGVQPTDLVAADFNADGHPDVATLNIGDTDVQDVTVLLYERIDNGLVVFTRTNVVVGDRPSHLSVAEFNRDGRPDLVLLNRPREERIGEVRPLLSGPNAVLTPGAPLAVHCPELTVNCDALALTVGDFDNDDVTDVAITLNQTGQGLESDVMRVLLGSGDGGFIPGPTLDTEDQPLAMATGDFTGDGLTDVVVTSEETDSVQVYVNVSINVSN